MKQFYLVFLLIILLVGTGCKQREYSSPGPPLIYISFNDTITNSGVLPVEFRGNRYVSYEKGISDSSLNLSGSALYRKPVFIDKGPKNSFSDYKGFSVLIWVKAMGDDPHTYEIISQKKRTENDNFEGWHIGKTATGGWEWEFRNGDQKLRYDPPHTHQPIDDGEWHMVGFTIDTSKEEARFYYDGDLKSVYSMEGFETTFPETHISVGAGALTDNPQTNAFNGMVDEMGIWSRALSAQQVTGFYKETYGYVPQPLPEYKDSLTVMTWNIRNGGTLQGKHVGVQRVAEVIRHSKADIVALQETMGSGETLADELDFYYYRRSTNLSILSRFPLAQSFNAFRATNFGMVNVDIGGGRKIAMGPVWLSKRPNLSAYFMKNNARADTIEVREMETRGRETNFILSEIRPFIENADNVPVILAGDFNSGSHLDWTERNKERHNDLVVDFPATQFMESAGFQDAYRQIWPDETKTPGITWSPLYKEGLQTRMDFIFFKGEQLEPAWAKVIDTYRFGFPSDHAAVVVSFKINEP
ncbi:MAG: endonuclease/exonuclease/phosphatase family protein [Marinilabiliaceae bacterium]